MGNKVQPTVQTVHSTEEKEYNVASEYYCGISILIPQGMKFVKDDIKTLISHYHGLHKACKLCTQIFQVRYTLKNGIIGSGVEWSPATQAAQAQFLGNAQTVNGQLSHEKKM